MKDFATDLKTTRSIDLELLHPACRNDFRELYIYLQNAFKSGECRSDFRVFEAYRHPVRQKYLLGQVPPVTKAGPFQSAHNFGMAVDFVPRIFVGGNYQYSWDDEHDWAFLSRASSILKCNCEGLSTPIKWDRPHVEHSIFKKLKAAGI